MMKNFIINDLEIKKCYINTINQHFSNVSSKIFGNRKNIEILSVEHDLAYYLWMRFLTVNLSLNSKVGREENRIVYGCHHLRWSYLKKLERTPK